VIGGGKASSGTSRGEVVNREPKLMVFTISEDRGKHHEPVRIQWDYELFLLGSTQKKRREGQVLLR